MHFAKTCYQFHRSNKAGEFLATSLTVVLPSRTCNISYVASPRSSMCPEKVKNFTSAVFVSLHVLSISDQKQENEFLSILRNIIFTGEKQRSISSISHGRSVWVLGLERQHWQLNLTLSRPRIIHPFHFTLHLYAFGSETFNQLEKRLSAFHTFDQILQSFLAVLINTPTILVIGSLNISIVSLQNTMNALL